MAKTMTVVFLGAILVLSLTLRGVSSTYAIEESIEPNQTTGTKCLVGALYLESMCLVADGNPEKCINMSSLIYGLPCLFYDGVFGGDELTMTQCLVGATYIQISCLVCEGDVLKCLSMANFNFFAPCLYRATNNGTNDPDPSS
jgi:hypothetical protein